jgi:hypothetical protein
MILATCRLDIQKVMNEVIKTFDNSIICGRRGEREQEKAFKEKRSKAHFGESPHNYPESFAVDAPPYPIDWRGEKELLEAAKAGDFKEVIEILHNLERWTLYAGHVLATARQMKERGEISIELKWGGDWDRDTHLSDNRFDDFPHFEIVGWREMVS